MADVDMTDEAAVIAHFDELQQWLVPLWKSIEAMNTEEQTIVVVPSVPVVGSGALLQALEERFLFLLFLLRQPRARLIYVTSQSISPEISEYYVDLLAGVIISQASRRLHLVGVRDSSFKTLTDKILARPRLIQQLRDLIPDPTRAHLVPYSTTEAERDLAVALGIPMYAADPRFFHFGTKTGCRRLFSECGVSHPLGFEGLKNRADIHDALKMLRAERPTVADAIVKTNEGLSGSGNATVDLRDLPPPGSAEEDDALAARIDTLKPEAARLDVPTYLQRFEAQGGIVEERISGDIIESPSVQMRVTPLGKLEVLSTHDQLLGGPTGQYYLGCKFPADPAYATAITAEAVKVGERLAKEGVIGRFALDFLVVRDGDAWIPYAIEVNLRKGGTTHPFLTLQFLTEGQYDAERGEFRTPSGQTRSFVATDHVERPEFRGLSPLDVFEMAVTEGIHYDHPRQKGVVFHMLSALSELGRVGFTAVAETAEEAQALYERTISLLERTAKGAWVDRQPAPQPTA